MTRTTDLRAPFPYFGGKANAASLVWAALGDVHHYVEPFMGSLAVLLARPVDPQARPPLETANDIDGLLVNAWRAIRQDPEAVALAVDSMVSEADLLARHLALVRWRETNDLGRLMADPTWCDPIMAGWWLWGAAAHIGTGWCEGRGAWTAQDGVAVRLPSSARSGASAPRQMPDLYNTGRGISHARFWSFDGDQVCQRRTELLRALADRLRFVRLLHGSWERLLSPSALIPIEAKAQNRFVGIFFDPPYSDPDVARVYTHADRDVARRVRDWCVQHGDHPKLRIVLAGYEGEHDMPPSWRCIPWFQHRGFRGGFGMQSGTKGQQHRERLWLSPQCLH